MSSYLLRGLSGVDHPVRTVRLKRVELSGFLPLINITWWRIGYQYRWWHIAVDSIGSCIILLFKSISKLFFRFHLRKRWLIKIMVVPKNMLIYIVLILSVLIQKKSEFPKRRENEIRGLNSSSWGSGHLKLWDSKVLIFYENQIINLFRFDYKS